MACELPAEQGVPLSRWSAAELAREAVGARDRRADQRRHGLALARRRRDQALAAPLLDLPARPALRRAGRPDPRPLRRALAGRVAPSRRLRDLRRRETVDPGAQTDRRHPSRPARRAASGSSTSTSGWARSATSPPGTPAAPRSSTAARPRTASSPFDALVDQFMSEHPYSGPSASS